MSKRQELEEDIYDEPTGLLAKIKRRMGLDEVADDDYEEDEESSGRRNGKVLVRVHTPRAAEISVWVSPRTLNDIQPAADRLKERRPVIINLERTDEHEARRVVDFISGVTYALDGYYQRVGEKVYVFTPSNTLINVEDDLGTGQPGSLLDRR